MKMNRILSSTALLIVALGFLTAQSAQDVSTQTGKSDQERFVGIALLRTINTAELVYKTKYASYATWQMLLRENPKYFEDFLSMHGLLQKNLRFSDAQEVLPGWKLRLNVHTDGQGYDVLLEDATDIGGYAILSDERVAIRQCMLLR